MSEIKIQENRFLALIECEKFVPIILEAFLKHLVVEWKKTNSFKTKKERELLLSYIDSCFKEVGFDYSFYFNNSYNNCLQFRDHQLNNYFVKVTEVNHSTGESIEY